MSLRLKSSSKSIVGWMQNPPLLNIFKSNLRRSTPGLALARVKLALGNPNAALELLTPSQRITSSMQRLYWCARVRVATTNHQAAATVQEALQTSAMPAHVIEEWRMITSGLIRLAGTTRPGPGCWRWVPGPMGSLEPYWNGTQKRLAICAMGVWMRSRPSGAPSRPVLQTKAQQLNRQITQTWLQGLPPRPNPWPGPRRRWLLCGDRGFPQCWLYRVQQKQEQLQALGGEPSCWNARSSSSSTTAPAWRQGCRAWRGC